MTPYTWAHRGRRRPQRCDHVKPSCPGLGPPTTCTALGSLPPRRTGSGLFTPSSLQCQGQMVFAFLAKVDLCHGKVEEEIKSPRHTPFPFMAPFIYLAGVQLTKTPLFLHM